MKRRALAVLLAAVLLVGAAAALARGSTLTLFATLTPKDPARRVVSGAAYGPGPRRRLDVYAPLHPHGPLPVVMFFYGGGWSSGSRTDYGWAARALASRGFLVVAPDYRLAPEVTYPGFVDDGAAAARWAEDHAAAYGGDPARLFLVGHSAGAYIAVMLALDDAFLRRAGVDPAHVRGAVGLSGPYDFYPFTVKDSRDAFGPYPDPEATQPIRYASRPGRPPMLLIQGGRDQQVRPRNALNLDRALRAAGNRSTVRLYPSLGHAGTVLALSIPFRGKAPILAEVTGFLRTQAGRVAP